MASAAQNGEVNAFVRRRLGVGAGAARFTGRGIPSPAVLRAVLHGSGARYTLVVIEHAEGAEAPLREVRGGGSGAGWLLRETVRAGPLGPLRTRALMPGVAADAADAVRRASPPGVGQRGLVSVEVFSAALALLAAGDVTRTPGSTWSTP